MNTVRSEKDSMGAIDVPADKLWAHKLNARWSISAFRRRNAHLTDSCAGANQARSGKS